MKKVSIIVLNWNGKDLLKKCIESIKKETTYPDYEVIVVDNGSKDGSKELINELKKKKLIQQVIFNPENKGFATANNQGFKIAKGDYFLMLNNDILATKNWLTELVKLLESDKKIAGVSSTLLSPKQFERGFSEFEDKEKQAICGAAMLMKTSALNKVGVLDDEEFSPIYGEEQDWCYRARNHGYKVVESGKSILIHLGSHDTIRQTGKEWQFELINTHRIKAMLFNLSFFEFLHHVPGLGLIAVQSLKHGKFRLLLKSYWNNFSDFKRIWKKRKQRLKKAKENHL